MLSTLLIFLPIGAALATWLLPWRTAAQAGLFALMIAAGELGIWIGAVAGFDFGRPGLHYDTTAVWFSDLGVSYKVGLYDFSLWLVGLTIGVSLVAIAYGMRAGRERARAYNGLMLLLLGVSYKVGLYDFSLWLVGLTIGVSLVAIAYGLRAGRERARAYNGLMLLLLGATVGVFAAQDLLLFYVFFEAMLIPLYVLVGLWGGRNSRVATIKLIVYTMAGSLLMLVAIVALGLTQGTFDLTQMSTSGSLAVFLGFALAFGIKAPVWPLHGWLPDAYREAPPEVSAVLSGVVSKTAAYGFLRIALPIFPEPVADARNWILALAAVGLVYGSLLAFRQPDFRGVIAYSSLAQMCLIVIGLFAVNDSGLNGALLQMVNHGLISATLFILAGCVEARTHTGQFSRLGGMARGRPALATLLIVTGVIALAVPGSSAFAAEFLVLNGIFSIGWGWAVVGAIAIVLAAMYMLRAISAALHEEKGPAVHDRQGDLRFGELAVLVPLVAVLLFLSFWPAGVTDHSFGGTPASSVVSHFEGAP